ncbi:MAG: hypothetical protein CO108_00495 [Deltaproteobacteria bacterium CG_4_9_14_3_um_filter_63_12]|nr:MAG: hypothetical protein CO108_00495 [Deltaproteobacteria bacterium CG_4_9_14_3_um_filter_63_12]
MFNPSPLAGATAIITGASGGIGSTVAKALGVAGASLALTGKTNAKLQRRREELVGLGLEESKLFTLAADLSTAKACEGVVNAAAERFGRVDILVNAAGVGVLKRFNELELADIDDVVSSNLLSTLYMCHHVVPKLMSEGGHIINIGSGLGKRGAARSAAYSAAKFGVQGFSEALRIDLARYNIRVSCVSPAGAGVDTEFWDRADPLVKRKGMLAPERVAEVVLVLLTTRGTALIDDLTLRTR